MFKTVLYPVTYRPVTMPRIPGTKSARRESSCVNAKSTKGTSVFNARTPAPSRALIARVIDCKNNHRYGPKFTQ